MLNDVAGRTANIVGYVGEWHSHPRHCTATPSVTDRRHIGRLAEVLAQDGQPALMIIVGDHDFSISVKEA